jgi:hypothetical protein
VRMLRRFEVSKRPLPVQHPHIEVYFWYPVRAEINLVGGEDRENLDLS